jgi:hypothetical protein
MFDEVNALGTVNSIGRPWLRGAIETIGVPLAVLPLMSASKRS